MDWESLFQVLVSSGVLALIVGIIIRYVVKVLGDKLGWDEEKKRKWEARAQEIALQGIRLAEESAKTKTFPSKDEQRSFKHKIATGFVEKALGVKPEMAEVAVRAAFALSGYSKPVENKEAKVIAGATDPEVLIKGMMGG
jgi:hypothetical protein